MEENLNQSVIIENRKKFTLSGVKEVNSFDEETVDLETVLGKAIIKGTGLHISNFNTEIGEISGEGRVHAIIYPKGEEEGGFFSRLFK